MLKTSVKQERNENQVTKFILLGAKFQQDR